MIQRKFVVWRMMNFILGHLATNGKRRGIFDIELIRETIDSSVDDHDAILIASYS